MGNETRYLVSRIYNKQERSDPTERSCFYGWSSNKNVIKAFLQQRDSNKYSAIKISIEDFSKLLSEGFDENNMMIDFIKLKSAKTHEEFMLFMTKNEMLEAEIKIQRMFHELSSLISNCLELFINLEDVYADALDFIGYRPPEIDIIFPSADSHDDISSIYDIEDQIDSAYSASYNEHGKPMGLTIMDDVASMILYSLESFIKVLKEDM